MVDPEKLRPVATRQRHRGPDDTGFWASPSGCCALAHNRLAVLDLSSAAAQPMHDAEGRFTIVFNGEAYNFQELRKTCEAKGYRFRSTSDTEVVLAGYSLFGPDVLERIRGMFAMAVWDESERTLFLARDRFGEKPLYYSLELRPRDPRRLPERRQGAHLPSVATLHVRAVETLHAVGVFLSGRTHHSCKTDRAAERLAATRAN